MVRSFGLGTSRFSSRGLGTHPELLHLHAELSSRRDKRLELASRRRDYEIENATKRRKLDETGAWTTWKVRRGPLCVTAQLVDGLWSRSTSETNFRSK